MLQLFKRQPIRVGSLNASGLRLTFLTALFVLFSIPSVSAFQTTPNKIQQCIDVIKDAHYCENSDYHTDGKRTVWVKSYKKWTPDDLRILKKEDPQTLSFLAEAITRRRLDVLEQLLPIYYRTHGGVQAFAADVKRVNG